MNGNTYLSRFCLPAFPTDSHPFEQKKKHGGVREASKTTVLDIYMQDVVRIFNEITTKVIYTHDVEHMKVQLNAQPLLSLSGQLKVSALLRETDNDVCTPLQL